MEELDAKKLLVKYYNSIVDRNAKILTELKSLSDIERLSSPQRADIVDKLQCDKWRGYEYLEYFQNKCCDDEYLRQAHGKEIMQSGSMHQVISAFNQVSAAISRSKSTYNQQEQQKAESAFQLFCDESEKYMSNIKSRLAFIESLADVDINAICFGNIAITCTLSSAKKFL